MLYSIVKSQPITKIPHEKEYLVWTSRLSPSELDAIVRELDQRVSTDKIHTSSWMPGNDWTGTVFMPIYEKACLKNVDAAAKCFGLILWKVMMDRPEVWAFGHYAVKDIPIEGLTYFLIQLKP